MRENEQELISGIDGEIPKVETITLLEAGKVLGKNAAFIRVGLRQGRFDYFGTAVQGGAGKWNYLIIKSKFLEYVGLNLKVISILKKEEEMTRTIKEIAIMLETFPHI